MPKPKPSKREVLEVLKSDILQLEYKIAETSFGLPEFDSARSIWSHKAACLREAVKCVKKGYK